MRNSLDAILFALLAAGAALPSAPAHAGIVHSVVEDFTSTALRDSNATTAAWDTTSGRLRLAPYAMTRLGGAPTADTAEDVKVAGDYAFVAAWQAGMWSFDVRDPAHPVFADSIITTEQIAELDLQGDYAYAANVFAGLYILDISDPTNLGYVSRAYTVGQTQSVDVAGDYAYLADGPLGLTIIDIHDPRHPVERGHFNPTGGYGLHVRVSGHYAYVGMWIKGLWVIDVSDPDNPVPVANYDTPDLARAVAIDGNTLYLGDGNTGIMVFDITDPTAPVLLATVDTPGLARGVDVAGDILYVADHTGGVRTFDITNRAAPRLVSVWNDGTSAHRLTVAGDLAFVADGNDGMAVLRVADPVVPAVTEGSVPTAGGAPGRVVVRGNLAYVADGDAGLAIADITDAAAPAIAGTYRAPGQTGPATGVDVNGDMVYLASAGSPSFEVIDDAVPGALAPLAALTLGAGARDLLVDGDRAFVLENGTKLYALDVSNPTAPALVDSIAPGGAPAGAWRHGRLLFVADADARAFHVVDATTLSAMAVVGNYDGGAGSAAAITADGDYAYLALASGGVDVVDISDPTAPTYAGAIPVPGAASDVVVTGRRAYVAAGSDGLHVVDVTDPLSATILDTYTGAADARRVVVAGDRALVADAGFGLRAARVLQRSVDPASNAAQSLALAGNTGRTIVRVALAADETDAAAWSATADGGVSWQSMPADGTWQPVTTPGEDLRWRATLPYDPAAGVFDPSVDTVRLDWLYDTPDIQGIADVPADQGGEVTIRWRRSGHDFDDSPTPVVSYAIERRAAATSPSGGGGGRTPDVRPSLAAAVAWETVATVTAARSEIYGTVVPTLADSTAAAGAVFTTYRVVAQTADPGTAFVSAPDSGYSIDNLAPGAPKNLTIAQTATGNDLGWDPPGDPDVADYRVYRADAPGTPIGPSTLVAQTTDTTWHDPVYGGPWYYRVTAADSAGNEGASANAAVVSGIGPRATPRVFALHQNVPNPFNPSTTIRFDVPPAGGRVRLRIFDVAGRLVRTLVDGEVASGERTVEWTGLDDRGRRVASGVYFLRLDAPGFASTRKLVMVQ